LYALFERQNRRLQACFRQPDRTRNPAATLAAGWKHGCKRLFLQMFIRWSKKLAVPALYPC